MKQPHILIVEDDFFLYEAIADKLLQEGYSISEYCPSFNDAIKEIKKKRPNLALLDIQLQGKKTGIDLGYELQNKFYIPFIYITNFDDRNTFNLALKTKHEIFMVKTKPALNERLLLRNIETVLNRNDNNDNQNIQPIGITGLVNYLEKIHKNYYQEISRIKVPFKDIVLFSKDAFANDKNVKAYPKENYCWFLTGDGKRLFLKKSLEQILEITPYNFIRINGKYIVNLNSTQFKGRINSNRIVMGQLELQISDTYKTEFNTRMSLFFPD